MENQRKGCFHNRVLPRAAFLGLIRVLYLGISSWRKMSIEGWMTNSTINSIMILGYRVGKQTRTTPLRPTPPAGEPREDPGSNVELDSNGAAEMLKRIDESTARLARPPGTRSYRCCRGAGASGVCKGLVRAGRSVEGVGSASIDVSSPFLCRELFRTLRRVFFLLLSHPSVLVGGKQHLLPCGSACAYGYPEIPKPLK